MECSDMLETLEREYCSIQERSCCMDIILHESHDECEESLPLSILSFHHTSKILECASIIGSSHEHLLGDPIFLYESIDTFSFILVKYITMLTILITEYTEHRFISKHLYYSFIDLTSSFTVFSIDHKKS